MSRPTRPQDQYPLTDDSDASSESEETTRFVRSPFDHEASDTDIDSDAEDFPRAFVRPHPIRNFAEINNFQERVPANAALVNYESSSTSESDDEHESDRYYSSDAEDLPHAHAQQRPIRNFPDSVSDTYSVDSAEIPLSPERLSPVRDSPGYIWHSENEERVSPGYILHSENEGRDSPGYILHSENEEVDSEVSSVGLFAGNLDSDNELDFAGPSDSDDEDLPQPLVQQDAEDPIEAGHRSVRNTPSNSPSLQSLLRTINGPRSR